MSQNIKVQSFLSTKKTKTLMEDEDSQKEIKFINEFADKIGRFRKHPKQEILRKMKEPNGLIREGRPNEKGAEKIHPQLRDLLLRARLPRTQSPRRPHRRHRPGHRHNLREESGRTFLRGEKGEAAGLSGEEETEEMAEEGELRLQEAGGWATANKGKFLTREQICEQLGFESLENYAAEEIKELLERNMEESLVDNQPIC